MLALSTYSRPSELLKLKTFSLVRPAPGVTGSWSLLLSPEELQEPSKTGDFDVSILLDSPYTNCWAGKILKTMKANKSGNSPLWDFDYGQYLAVFKKCAKQMNVPLEPYHTRHSGLRSTEVENTEVSWKCKRGDSGRAQSRACGTRRPPAWPGVGSRYRRGPGTTPWLARQSSTTSCLERRSVQTQAASEKCQRTLRSRPFLRMRWSRLGL